MKSLSFVLVAGFAAGTVFADTYNWDPSERRTEFGAVTVGYSENADAVTSVRIKSLGTEDPASENFVGDTPFAFAEGATIGFAGGNLGFGTPVTGGGVSLAFDDTLAPRFASTDAFDDWLHSKDYGTDDLVFPGKKVSDYEFASAYLLSGAVQGTVDHPGFVIRTETTLSAQFQYFDSVNRIVKGVRVTLVDSPEGIRAHVDYARYAYVSWAYALDLDDLEAVQAKSGKSLPVARSSTDASGYGVRSVTIRTLTAGGQTMTVSNALYSVDSAEVGTGTKLVLDTLAEGSELKDFTIRASAELRLRNMPDVRLGGTFSAEAGRLAFEQPSLEIPIAERTLNWDTPITGSTPCQLLEKVSIDDVISWSVPELVNSIDTHTAPVMCHVVRTSDSIRFQLQLDDYSWVKGCVVEIYGSGGRIFVHKLFSAYWKPEQGKAGTVDMENVAAEFFMNKWTNSEAYSPKSLELTYRQEDSLESVTVPAALNSDAKILILKGANVDDIAFVRTDYLVGNMSYKNEPRVCFVRRSAGRYEFQLQIEEGTTLKGSQIVLYQNGNDIWGYKVCSWWSTATDRPKPGEMDLSSPEFAYTGKTTGDSYRPESLELIYRPRVHMHATVPGMGTATAAGLEVDVGENVTLTVGGGAGALPSGGLVTVAGLLDVTNSTGIGTSPIHVTTGGVMRIRGSNAVASGTPQTMTFDGGTLMVSDSYSYMNRPVFMNGASVVSSAGSTTAELRVGVANITWSVRGSSCSTSTVPIRCVSGGRGANEFVMTWDVADVTGDDAVDFLMDANMTEFEDGTGQGFVTPNGGMVHRKAGAGTLLWNGLSTCTGCVQVADGTLLLGRTGALNLGTSANVQLRARQPLEFCGGTLAAQADTTNAVASVSLSGTGGALDLADGAVLTADSVGAFEDGARLAVTLGEGAAFKVGQRLSAAQLRTIRVNDMRAFQDDDGSLYGMKTGVLLLVR